MKHKEYFNGFDDFDEESQNILISSYGKVLVPNAFNQNSHLQKINNATESTDPVSEIIDWETDEYFNLNSLIGSIKYSKNGYGNFQFPYNINDFKSNFQNKTITDDKGNRIRLKVYRNPKIGDVSLKIKDVVISQNIDAKNKIIYYCLTFHYVNSDEKAFILETYSYQELKNLNVFLGYIDIEKYPEAQYYFCKNYADVLRNELDPERLKFIYGNIPKSILSNLSTLIENETFFNHLEILSADDDSNMFRDSSTAVIQIFKTFDNPVPILNYYRKNPEKLNRIYYNLDGNSAYEGQQLSNRKILGNIMMVLCMFSKNTAQKETAKTFVIGQGYKVNSDIAEFGIFQGGNKKYANTFFLQQQKEVQENIKIVPKEGDPNAKETVTKDIDQGAQFHPLDMVYLKDLSGEKEQTYLVPAIYLKALADAEEWEVVMQNIRIAADLVAVVIGIATLPTGNPYFLLLAIADITLAGADLTIQAFKNEIVKYEGGKEFLETWEKIYTTGGFAIAGLTLVGGFYVSAAKLLTKAADGSAKTYLKTLVLKAILETNISNFQKNTVKVIEPKEIFLGQEYLAMGNRMAENGVIFLSGQKEGKFAESFAAVYKGEMIEEFSRAEMSKFYKKWNKLKGEELLEALENVYKKATFEFKEFSKSVPEFATDSTLAKESYKLFKQQKWKELEELFKARNIKWPPFDGFVKKGVNILKRGVEIDRYGGEIDSITGLFKDTGNYFAKKGTKFSERALPANYEREKILSSYKVLKDLPVIEGDAIPWFNQKGLGLQYKTMDSVDELISQGYIEVIKRKL